jgi:aminoglycoside phosphotransferase (APT) family kinase protein
MASDRKAQTIPRRPAVDTRNDETASLAVKMFADEVDIDVPLVRDLVTAQFPQWANLPIEPVLPLGTDNANYRLGDEMVVRLPRRERTTGPLEKERLWLPRLAPFLTLAIPAPLAEGEPSGDDPVPWSVYGWLKGENATSNRVGDPDQLAIDLAKFIASLQAVNLEDGPPPGKHNFFRGEPLAARDSATRAAMAVLESEIDAEAVNSAWEAALSAPPWQRPPRWIHGDLDSRNLLVKEGRLSAVIDFGCLGVGDPACDVMVAWKLLPGDSREIFRATLRVDDATWARGRGWALSQALGALSYYSMQTYPTLVLEARRWLAAVLGDGTKPHAARSARAQQR